MTAAQVMVLGDLAVDLFLTAPHYPRAGEETVGEALFSRAGGSAANTAAALALMGVPTRFVGRVGNDAWAELALGAMRASGVLTNSIARDPDLPTGLTFIAVTPDGERTMFGFRGANLALDEQALTDDLLNGVAIVHMAGYSFMQSPQREAAYRAMALAESHRAIISVDTALEPVLRCADELRHILPRLGLCVLGKQEAQLLTGKATARDAARDLLAAGVRRVGIKLGREGCLIAEGDHMIDIGAFAVQSVDATGAGDAFSAAMMLGWLRGASLTACGLLASAYGALATTVWGGGASLPPREQAIALLRREAIDHVAMAEAARLLE